MRVLGIETSCDETGVAIFDDQNGLLSNQIYSQGILHSRYGGVVPELASREHICKIIPLIQTALRYANISIEEIDAVAYTAGPGLVGSLLVGATVSCGLAFSLEIPAIPIHHIEGHLLTPMLESHPPEFPFLALLVSGGHTQIIIVYNIGRYRLLGESIDDAAGEAFDKIATLLGLDYPGGPLLSRLAQKGKKGRFTFPRPMINRLGFDFSFSGLKSAVANVIRNSDNDKQTRADIARAFEDAIIDTLMIKCQRALDFTNLKRLAIVGGVSANHSLREQSKRMMLNRSGKIFYARPELCTDNGAMIAYVGMVRLKGGVKNEFNISIHPKWTLTELL